MYHWLFDVFIACYNWSYFFLSFFLSFFFFVVPTTGHGKVGDGSFGHARPASSVQGFPISWLTSVTFLASCRIRRVVSVFRLSLDESET